MSAVCVLVFFIAHLYDFVFVVFLLLFPLIIFICEIGRRWQLKKKKNVDMTENFLVDTFYMNHCCFRWAIAGG